MRSVPFLIGLLILVGGCSAWRGAPEIRVAPDPVVYPAPAELPRYIPWVNRSSM